MNIAILKAGVKKMEQYTLGVDVGGTKIAYGVFDGQRNLLLKRREPSDASLSPELFFDGIAEGIRELMAELMIAPGALKGIGMGMPSFIEYKKGYILKTSNLTKIKNFAARDYLAAKLDGISILLDNDAHTAALAEYKYGAGRGFEHMLYCPVSTGISSGIIINGQLFRGSYGWAGESGHMIASPGHGISCGCGNSGCFMSWCSGSMIVRHIRQWIADGKATILTELAGSTENILPLHLDEAWERGDELAMQAVEQMALYMAAWLYNLYVTLNINCFVFGGGLLKMGDKLFGRMREIFDAYNQDDEHPVYFRNAELGEDFGIIGAAELVNEERKL
jgi:glucokinase